MSEPITVNVLLCAAVILLGHTPPVQATEYKLTGVQIRHSIIPDIANRYRCDPRPEFLDALECNLETSSSSKPSAPRLAHTLIKSPDEELLYAYNKFQIAEALDQATIRIASEISDSLAGATPTQFNLADGIAVAIWGDTKLEEISSHTEEYTGLTDLVEQKYGLLLSATGSLDSTRENYLPIYRVVGGDGLVLFIYQDGPNHVTVQEFIVAAGTLAEKNFESQARQFLAQDRSYNSDDFSSWPEVAFMIRRLALNTTPETANIIVDRVFGGAADNKYYSHVWALLPTSVIKHLALGTYRATDVFDENTEFPKIRNKILDQLEGDPTEPYSEFLLYTLGRFSEAVDFNPSSPIHTVLSYAQGHSTLRNALSIAFESIAKPGDRKLLEQGIVYYSHKYNFAIYSPWKEETLQERYVRLAARDFVNDYAYAYVPFSSDDYKDGEPSVTQYINYFNKFPERYNSRPLVHSIPDLMLLTDALLPPLEDVLKDEKSPHYDDAAYLLGWLAFHRGHVAEALDRFGSVVDLLPGDDDSFHDDYAGPALHQITRIFRTLPPTEVIERIQASNSLSSHPVVWDTVLTSFYQSHQYEFVVQAALQALRNFGIVVEDLPVTTDPGQIMDALAKLKLADGGYLTDIVYLFQSSQEMLQLSEILLGAEERSSETVQGLLTELILKYSLSSDADVKLLTRERGFKPQHKDLRQSIFLIGKSLDLLPRTADYSEFREWLHYRRIRLLAQFDPFEVAAANAEFRDEFPQSLLLDDGLAEQILGEAVIVGDMTKATGTFASLRQRYPHSNSLDNAYSWMAIGWTCSGQPVKGREIDEEIIRLFPLTRHARFARERIENPKACSALLELYFWDYEAMLWRERNRIDTIQALFNDNGKPLPSPAEGLQEPTESLMAQSASDVSSRLTQIQAVELISNLFQLHMSPGEAALLRLRNYYAESIEYYGKTSALEEVVADKVRYFDRWPTRDYRLQYDSIDVDCSGGQTCRIAGYFDWSVLSIKRRKVAAGTASFEYVISAEPPYVVIRETGEVVKQ